MTEADEQMLRDAQPSWRRNPQPFAQGGDGEPAVNFPPSTMEMVGESRRNEPLELPSLVESPGESAVVPLAGPWSGSVGENDDEEFVATIQKGDIYASLDDRVPIDLGITFPFTTDEVVDGSKVFMKIDYAADPGDIADAVFTIEVLDVAWDHSSIVPQEWETDDESADYEKQLIGRIAIGQVDDVDGTLTWTPIAKNDWWLSTKNFNRRLADWPSVL